ncbi:MAG: CRISPR system precrRNA processing endoribonuclease RAMP protein Cas6 [Endomicrobia bacterium]|nr:CRISPR system precrRNA processing endoribonuclease RAMP protein Cas6 [Endomicrobiia bacterium]MCL2506291.1 CRISPR system precrRNA processing endoribonuclease RAMP protein Cas6 [Endomicrobiia bacterium]
MEEQELIGMHANDLLLFSLNKYAFHLTASEDMLLPSYKSSMFRGGFGRVFKSLNCVNRISKDCQTCPIKNSCSYFYIFEEKTYIPMPYIISSEFNDKRKYSKGEIITFELTLFGKAREYLPHFIFSFIELGVSTGLAKKQYKYKLTQVSGETGNIIFDGEKFVNNAFEENQRDAAKKNTAAAEDNPANTVTLSFKTPLRLSVKHVLTPANKINFELIVKALTSRINAIAKAHCGYDPMLNPVPLIKKAKDIKIKQNGLVWTDWTRYSNKQKTQMDFGGLLGDIIFEGDFSDFMPYLNLGQKIHIGKNTTFGLGKYLLK